jgi:hypothetical protein
MNTRHEVLDWFGPSRRVIALRAVLMHYAIEIGSSFFRDLSGSPRDLFQIILDVNLSSLFIVGKPPHRV